MVSGVLWVLVSQQLQELVSAPGDLCVPILASGRAAFFGRPTDETEVDLRPALAIRRGAPARFGAAPVSVGPSAVGRSASARAVVSRGAPIASRRAAIRGVRACPADDRVAPDGRRRASALAGPAVPLEINADVPAAREQEQPESGDMAETFGRARHDLSS